MKEYWSPADYQWLESFTGTTGNLRSAVMLEEPDFNLGIFYRYVVQSFNVKSFETQLRFLYKFAHHQKQHGFVIKGPQLVVLLEQILDSGSDMPDFARRYFENEATFYRHPMRRGEPVGFDVVSELVRNADTEMYWRLRDEIRAA
jgi:hypothetical protein